MFRRKVRKLIKSPKAFFSDMAYKHINRAKKLQPKVKDAKNKFIVVSAIFNVGRYLDDFLNSVVSQRLDFKSNIKLILVDDGSTDESAKIIKKWQRKYPNNITYIYKENGGQASARNLGLEHAGDGFVTFIDPDDFLNRDYFLKVEQAINKYYNNNVAYISCKLTMFLESNNSYQPHPLNFKFSKKTEIIELNSKKNLQLSSASAFFNMKDIQDYIAKGETAFPCDCKPGFEDAFFINDLATKLNKSQAILVPDSEYYYRRREDGTSTVDNTWSNDDKYSTVFNNGYCKLANNAMSMGHEVPLHIQQLIMYELSWYIKRFLYTPLNFHRLSAQNKNNLKVKMREALSYISPEVINNFHVRGFWLFYKLATLYFSGKQNTLKKFGYVKSINSKNKTIEVSVFTTPTDNSYIKLLINDNSVVPADYKIRSYDFLGMPGVFEHQFWIDYSHAKDILKLRIDNEIIEIEVMKNGWRANSVMVARLLNHFQADNVNNNKHIWLFMDKDSKADDNAEHLYRFVKNNYPNKTIYFSLKKGSVDWDRLQNDGFNLVSFESDEYFDILKKSEKIISSHNSNSMLRNAKKNDVKNIDFVFLQHGITHNNVSSAFNNIDINTFVTASKFEFDDIGNDYSEFKFPAHQVALCGFPRHDALYEGSLRVSPDSIVIMPTWRESIVGKYTGSGHQRTYNEDFKNTEYCNKWSALLNDKNLMSVSQKQKIIFIPHPEIMPYILDLKIPHFIEIIDPTSNKIQDIFVRATILVTDYSSVAFDLAYIGKPTIYFQFDIDDFYGAHYRKGYFDYHRDGFGPVFESEVQLTSALNDFVLGKLNLEKYKEKAKDFFLPRDGLNCHRTLLHIENANVISPDERYSSAVRRGIHASNSEEWQECELSLEPIVNTIIKKRDSLTLSKLIQAKRELGKPTDAIKIATSYLYENISKDVLDVIKQYYLVLAFTHQWQLLYVHSKNNKTFKYDDEILALFIRAMNRLGLSGEINNTLKGFSKKKISPCIRYMSNVLLGINKEQSLDFLFDKVSTLSAHEILAYDPLLFLAQEYRSLKKNSKSIKALNKRSVYIKNDLMWRHEVALTCYDLKDFKKVINQIKISFSTVNDIPQYTGLIYVKALRKDNRLSEALQISEKLNSIYESSNIKLEIGEILFEKRQWHNAVQVLEEIQDTHSVFKKLQECYKSLAQESMQNQDWDKAIKYFRKVNVMDGELLYELAYCYRMTGDIDSAFSYIRGTDINNISFASLNIIAELAMLNGAWDLASESWLEMIKRYPTLAPSEAWNRLQHSQIMYATSNLPNAAYNLG